jgi:HEPN domain-containing protein
MDGFREEAIRRPTDAADEDVQVSGLCLQAQPPACRGGAFHAQQAAGKYMKACLIALGSDDPPATHSLPHLASLLAGAGGPQFALEPLRALSRLAVAPRYGDTAVTQAQAQRAVAEARRIVDACAAEIETARRRP